MRVGILLYHHVNELDVVGPYTVLSTARSLLENPADLEVCSVAKSRNSVQTQAEMTITPSWGFASAPPLNGLLVPGGVGVEAASRDRAVRQYLESVRDQLELLGSVSSGALLLGELGFLRGQTVTTQAGLRARLEDYEVLKVSSERVVAGKGGFWSASGSVAGLELALAIVRQRFGDALARQVAQRLELSLQPSLF